MHERHADRLLAAGVIMSSNILAACVVAGDSVSPCVVILQVLHAGEVYIADAPILTQF